MNMSKFYRTDWKQRYAQAIGDEAYIAAVDGGDKTTAAEVYTMVYREVLASLENVERELDQLEKVA